MTAPAPDAPPPVFLPLAAVRGGLRLRCLLPFAAPAGRASLLALCRGVECGRLELGGPLAEGAELLLPIARLPRTELPAELRFALAPEGPDLAPPWPLPNAAAALALLGPPAAPEVEAMRLEQGMLRGIAVERANGLLEPVMYARINDAGARGVTTERPWPLPEGGCAFRFSLALEPGDLNETGLSVALHLVGVAAPIARFAYARIGLEGPVPKVAELEARLARVEQQAAATAQALQEELRRQAAMLAERTDAFIETAAALLLDRLAVEPATAEAGTDPRAAALRRLLSDTAASAVPTAEPLLLGRRAEIPPAAGNLAIGWHRPEEDAGGAFRWMGDAALVVNPEPHRPVASVEIGIRYLYGAAEPGLAGAFDALPASVTLARDAAGRFQLRLVPEGGAPVACQGLRLAATHAGIPLRDGGSPDPRLLSVAVTGVVFEYDE